MRVWVASGDDATAAAVDRAALHVPLTRVASLNEADAIVAADAGIDAEALRRLRRQRPDAILVVHTMELSPDHWRALEREGVDRVINSGGLSRELRRIAAAPSTGRLVYLASAADVAGRLGILACVSEGGRELLLVKGDGPPVCLEGPCPHAGASLAAAPCGGGVLTCPRHGSQFAIADGSRVRGPSDLGLRLLPVLLVDGRYAVRAGSG